MENGCRFSAFVKPAKSEYAENRLFNIPVVGESRLSGRFSDGREKQMGPGGVDDKLEACTVELC